MQKAREAARTASCANNLKQIGLAMANFETRNGHYPPSWLPVPSDGTDRDGWSAQSVLLPYLEQTNLSATLNYSQTFDNASATIVTLADGTTAPVTSLRIPTFICPSEKQDTAKFKNGVAAQYPLNYAVNLGTWFVWDPTTGNGGNGMFYPGSNIRATDIVDGSSYTLCASEVKAYPAHVPQRRPDGPACDAHGSGERSRPRRDLPSGQRPHASGSTADRPSPDSPRPSRPIRSCPPP